MSNGQNYNHYTRAQTILFFHFQMCCCVERRTLSIRHVKKCHLSSSGRQSICNRPNVISFGSRICLYVLLRWVFVAISWHCLASIYTTASNKQTNNCCLALVGCVLKLTCVLTNHGPVVEKQRTFIIERPRSHVHLDSFVRPYNKVNIGSNAAIRDEKILGNFFSHICFVLFFFLFGSGHSTFILFAKCNCLQYLTYTGYSI